MKLSRTTQSIIEHVRVNCGMPSEAVYTFRNHKLIGICRRPFMRLDNEHLMFDAVACCHEAES